MSSEQCDDETVRLECTSCGDDREWTKWYLERVDPALEEGDVFFTSPCTCGEDTFEITEVGN